MSKNVTIIAGPNGSGKTTFAREYLTVYNYEYVSADEIAFELASEELEKVRLQAGRLFFQRIFRRIEEEKNFVVEVTLAGLGFQRIISRLKQAEYTVTIVFIFVESPDVCIARVKERVMNGGHDVPTVDIVRRFYRSKDNFWRIYKNKVDRWNLFYNSSEHFQEVATGEEDNFTVRDEGLFELFMRDVT